ncbi:MAG: DoxX family membrane protein [Ferruginibacter sp.]|nr:DoxX family membrane protein [Ferruginibacter sp.]
MNSVVQIARILVGSLFVFSGLVKAIDPLGLGYKMQEFFEVWAGDGYLPGLMNYLHSQSLWFSITMIVIEIVLGIGLLIGWKKNMVLSFLLLLTLFFTFLTSYVLFTGKIRACGCFGDCIPLTPIQTFIKDIVLSLLIIFLLIYKKYIQPLFKTVMGGVIILLSITGATFLQFYVLKHLPLRDCLPYKKGNNILELRKMPAGAVPDKYEYIFVYEKNGEKKDFTTDNLPDSSWKFADRKQKLVTKGINNIPAINDFSLSDSAGVNVTEAILGQPGEYYLLFLQNMNTGVRNWSAAFSNLAQKARQQNRPVYIITADKEKVNAFFNIRNVYNIPVLTSDATAIKTAARANPTLFVMKGPVVQGKYSWADIDKAIMR